jgi:hypothetical protein
MQLQLTLAMAAGACARASSRTATARRCGACEVRATATSDGPREMLDEPTSNRPARQWSDQLAFLSLDFCGPAHPSFHVIG